MRIIDKNIFGSTKSYSSFDISTSEEKYNERFIITGVGGAILTKDLIDSQYLNDDSFIVVAPKTDDIWISKIIELSGTSVVSCPQALSQVHEIQHSNSSLSSQNTLFRNNMVRLSILLNYKSGYSHILACSTQTMINH